MNERCWKACHSCCTLPSICDIQLSERVWFVSQIRTRHARLKGLSLLLHPSFDLQHTLQSVSVSWSRKWKRNADRHIIHTFAISFFLSASIFFLSDGTYSCVCYRLKEAYTSAIPLNEECWQAYHTQICFAIPFFLSATYTGVNECEAYHVDERRMLTGTSHIVWLYPSFDLQQTHE